MEADTVQVNGLVNGIEEPTDEQSLSLEGSDVSDACVDQEIFPRVGEQYQVEMPPLMSQSDYCWLQKNVNEVEGTAASLHDFSVGLPIPIIWIGDEVEKKSDKPPGNSCKSSGIVNKSEFAKLKCNKKSQNSSHSNESNSKHEAIDQLLANRANMRETANFNVQHDRMNEAHESTEGRRGICLVPEISVDIWNEKEEARFILSLYIFGKNLVQVKRFIGNKKMRDILSFYYGKFYKSGRYCRWSECRKMKGRKCIYGQKIFTGPRQQELLSRLQPNLSEECRKSLLEVSKAFTEGRMILEDYVLNLKDLVGFDALVEAVGIGKGKEDLTVYTADSSKSNHALPARPEMPAGKACSMLTPAEIIYFLTGGFRLSKARSSDLFWEAVWPRLLARGWHSEQPGSYNYALPSKNSLVFLIPGVKKFSRKLVKGNHYFDSVSDVLSKVASDPELIELESVVTDNNCKSVEENGWANETKLDRENSPSPDQQRHSYLKPRTPNRSMDVIKFTVVDTSLASDKMSKVRELRNLPVGILAYTSENDSDSEDTSEDLTDESESVNTMCNDRKNADVTKSTKANTGREVSSEIDFKNKPSSKEHPTGSTNLYLNSKDRKTDLLSNTQRKSSMKFQSSSRQVPDDKNVIGPVTKRRRRLSACSRAERNSNVGNILVAPRVKQEEASCCCDSSNPNNAVSLGENPTSENKEIAYPPLEFKKFEDLSIKPGEFNLGDAFSASSSSCHDDQQEKPQKRTMIDLNVPVLPEAEADEPCNAETAERQQNNTREGKDDSCAATVTNPEDIKIEQPNTNTRRQSTRNRPLTARVLEAYALGYLDRKEKRKGRDYPLDSSSSRPSRRVCGKKRGETFSSNGANFQKEERTNVVCNKAGETSGSIGADFQKEERTNGVCNKAGENSCSNGTVFQKEEKTNVVCKKTGETSSSNGADSQRDERTNVVCSGNVDVILTGSVSNKDEGAGRILITYPQ